MTSRIEIDIEPPKEVVDFIIDNEEKVAGIIQAEARATTAFKDDTGKLRKSIKKRKSKYKDGGYIVIATAPHAHLVEFGHGGKSPAPAHPFLRTAKERVINEAKRIFGI